MSLNLSRKDKYQDFCEELDKKVYSVLEEKGLDNFVEVRPGLDDETIECTVEINGCRRMLRFKGGVVATYKSGSLLGVRFDCDEFLTNPIGVAAAFVIHTLGICPSTEYEMHDSVGES
jgi:hypothetical protein